MVADQKGYLVRVDFGQTVRGSERVVPADDCRAAKQVGGPSIDQGRH